MVDCYKCAFKHIATAKTVYYELRHGYHSDPIHIAWFIGEMNCAAGHLSSRQPDISEALRKDRTQVFDELVRTGSVPVYTPEFDVYLKEVFELIMENEGEVVSILTRDQQENKKVFVEGGVAEENKIQ